MNAFKLSFKILLSTILVIILGWGFISYYSIIFSRTVKGVVVDVKQIDTNIALMQINNPEKEKVNSPLYSAYAVAIKEKSGEIVTSSAEDRQWAVVQAGNCAEAVYYPYPPWRFEKSGTYYGARLVKLTECN